MTRQNTRSIMTLCGSVVIIPIANSNKNKPMEGECGSCRRLIEIAAEPH